MEEYEYLEILKSKDSNEIMELMRVECVIDTLTVKSYAEMNPDDTDKLIIAYEIISKYALICYALELMEAYEECAEIKTMVYTIGVGAFPMTNKKIEEAFNMSMENFRGNINLSNLISDDNKIQ